VVDDSAFNGTQQALSWYAAQSLSRIAGADLGYFEDATVFNFFATSFASVFQLNNQTAWIGGSIDSINTYRWSDGSALWGSGLCQTGFCAFSQPPVNNPFLVVRSSTAYPNWADITNSSSSIMYFVMRYPGVSACPLSSGNILCYHSNLPFTEFFQSCSTLRYHKPLYGL